MNRTIGIDPGRTGAIALLHNHELVQLVDLPATANGIDMLTLRSYLAEMWGPEGAPPATIVIEELPFMPNQYGQFTKARDLGRVEGVASLYDPTPIAVRPQTWKKHHGLIKQSKDASRELALELWPNAAPLLARKADVDRAEAALIARWWHDTNGT